MISRARMSLCKFGSVCINSDLRVVEDCATGQLQEDAVSVRIIAAFVLHSLSVALVVLVTDLESLVRCWVKRLGGVESNRCDHGSRMLREENGIATGAAG